MEFWIANITLFGGVALLVMDKNLTTSMRIILGIVLVSAVTASYSASETHRHTHEIIEAVTDRKFGENGAEL